MNFSVGRLCFARTTKRWLAPAILFLLVALSISKIDSASFSDRPDLKLKKFQFSAPYRNSTYNNSNCQLQSTNVYIALRCPQIICLYYVDDYIGGTSNMTAFWCRGMESTSVSLSDNFFIILDRQTLHYKSLDPSNVFSKSWNISIIDPTFHYIQVSTQLAAYPFNIIGILGVSRLNYNLVILIKDPFSPFYHVYSTEIILNRTDPRSEYAQFKIVPNKRKGGYCILFAQNKQLSLYELQLGSTPIDHHVSLVK